MFLSQRWPRSDRGVTLFGVHLSVGQTFELVVGKPVIRINRGRLTVQALVRPSRARRGLLYIPGKVNRPCCHRPGRILQLIAFANARREVAQPRFYTMPAPTKTVTFYKGDEFVCSLGEGRNFFSAACPGWRGIRNARPTEIQEFGRLIGGSK